MGIRPKRLPKIIDLILGLGLSQLKVPEEFLAQFNRN